MDAVVRGADAIMMDDMVDAIVMNSMMDAIMDTVVATFLRSSFSPRSPKGAYEDSGIIDIFQGRVSVEPVDVAVPQTSAYELIYKSTGVGWYRRVWTILCWTGAWRMSAYVENLAAGVSGIASNLSDTLGGRTHFLLTLIF